VHNFEFAQGVSQKNTILFLPNSYSSHPWKREGEGKGRGLARHSRGQARARGAGRRAGHRHRRGGVMGVRGGGDAGGGSPPAGREGRERGLHGWENEKKQRNRRLEVQ
jgi:hypothetical protein